MALTNALRAEVFAVDKGICAFSGVSLWILDYGASGLYNIDWADHIKPASRGGKDEAENLVCASSFYNMKKRHNGADNAYLFRRGRPTTTYYWVHGRLTEAHVAVMRGHRGLRDTDWFFNRALFNLLVQMDHTYEGLTRQRTPAYWRRAALSRLTEWRKAGGVNDFGRRGLLRYPNAPDVKLMLRLSEAETRSDVLRISDALFPYFVANSEALRKLVCASSSAARKARLKAARANRRVTAPTLAVLKENVRMLSALDGPSAVDV